MEWMLSDHEDDGFGTAGYYESIYDEPDDEEFFDDDEYYEDFDSEEDDDDEDDVEDEGINVNEE
jgi:hypothetical protein